MSCQLCVSLSFISRTLLWRINDDDDEVKIKLNADWYSAMKPKIRNGGACCVTVTTHRCRQQ